MARGLKGVLKEKQAVDDEAKLLLEERQITQDVLTAVMGVLAALAAADASENKDKRRWQLRRFGFGTCTIYTL